MHPNKGYDLTMRWLKSSAVVMLAMALLAPLSRAQVRGTPAPEGQHHTARSVTVTPAPRHAGVMPTPIGVSPAPAPAFPAPTPIGVPPMLSVPGTNNTAGNGFPHHHHDHDFIGGAYPVYVPVPVVVDPYSMYQATPDQADQETDDPPVVQGPTVFERRTPADVTATGSFAAAPSVEEPAPAAPDASPAQPESASSQPAQPQEPSVLVFHDGHQLQIQNYAIVGDFLYDFTPGHVRKVPLSQLDLPATVKANDDRGLDFTLPVSAKGGS
jgi:hypothetical protein